MKKNLFSILILALLVVNIVISVIMMISVTGASRKTAALVTDIASIMNMEIEGIDTSQAPGQVSIADITPFEIPDEMTISLKKGEDGKDHYALLKTTLSLNSANEDYATYGTTEAMTAKVSLIKSIINEVVSSHTADEVNNNQAGIRQEILTRIQEMYSSEFVYDVSFSSILVQ